MSKTVTLLYEKERWYDENMKQLKPVPDFVPDGMLEHTDFWTFVLNSNNELHCDDGPAMYSKLGTKQWWRNGKVYRDNDLPTLILYDGTQFWQDINIKRHRETIDEYGVQLPARIDGKTGKKEWWIHGLQISAPKLNVNFHKLPEKITALYKQIECIICLDEIDKKEVYAFKNCNCFDFYCKKCIQTLNTCSICNK
jgi:hypothetical protein